MIRYITAKFLSAPDRHGRKKAGILLCVMCIVYNLLLYILKYIAGARSSTIAITADSFNNLADFGSCIVTLLGFALADKRADRRFPNGYGRIEYLSGIIISLTIIRLGIHTAVSSTAKIIAPEHTSFSVESIIILSVSIIIKGYMYLCNKRIGERIKSPSLKAMGVDSLSDCFATAAIIISLMIEKLSGLIIDGYTGAMVSLCILCAGVFIMKESIGPLIGKAPKDTVKLIERLAAQDDTITAVYGISVHNYGAHKSVITLYLITRAEPYKAASHLKDRIREVTGAEAFINTTIEEMP